MINGFYPEGWLENTAENLRFCHSGSGLLQAAAMGKILEARAVSCDAAHNLYVELGDIKGIIPRSDGAVGIENGSTRDIALISRVGKPVCFTVTKVRTGKSGKTEALLSRRNAQMLCTAAYVGKLQKGEIIDARITHLDSFGAFCDIGCGVVALLPIDAISVSRISHPADRFFPGQDIKAVVKDISAEGRITLSHKELLGTWEENAASISQGETVSGIIRSVEDYGVFVEITPNLAGLAEPKADVYAGQRASVYVKSIIPEKMKIKLIIIDSFGEADIPRLDYYINSGQITRWRYSPLCCFKTVETVFGI